MLAVSSPVMLLDESSAGILAWSPLDATRSSKQALIAQGIAEVAKKHDIAVVCYSPLVSCCSGTTNLMVQGRGFLTGRYKSIDDFEEGDFRRNNPRFQGDNFQNNLKIVRDLEEVAKRHNATAGQIVLAWILQRGYYVIPVRLCCRDGL